MLTKVSSISQIKKGKTHRLPLFASKISAGFPSPADDFLEGKLDLNELMIEHPAATFFVRVSGNSMIGAGIHDGDMLAVDRSLTPIHGSIVIAVIDGELVVKRIRKAKRGLWLIPENNQYPPIRITKEHDLMIWGVVTYVIHKTE